MPFFPNSSLFWKNNARNINYMPALIFPKRLDLRKNAYSRTTSQGVTGRLTGLPKEKLPPFSG
jgi:hypothetical protein